MRNNILFEPRSKVDLNSETHLFFFFYNTLLIFIDVSMHVQICHNVISPFTNLTRGEIICCHMK